METTTTNGTRVFKDQVRSSDNVTFAKNNHSLQKVLSYALVHLICRSTLKMINGYVRHCDNHASNFSLKLTRPKMHSKPL